jgi:hypothetical protein
MKSKRSRYPDVPKSLCDATVVRERETFLHETHVEDLTRFVDRMRDETGRGREIPYFDPLDGGVDARCLFLFEAAGWKAVESGFVSRNNCDETARNFFRLNGEVGLDRRLTVAWNIVPWALRENGRNSAPKAADIREGLAYLEPLLNRLPNLEVILLSGRKAHKAKRSIMRGGRDLRMIETFHPSPVNINRRPYMWGEIRRALSEVARLSK